VRGCFANLVVPFVLMLAGATIGRMVIDVFNSQHGMIRDAFAVAGSVTAGAAIGACYFAVHFRLPLATLISASPRAPAPRS
jgi:hypothetical protein